MKRLAFAVFILALLLPAGASAADLPQDGQYTVEVTLSGGSGRAGVESPAKLTACGGGMTATIVWSSPDYTYMEVDGALYYPVNPEGLSAFEIPVVLDTDIPVSAETVAMSQPHVIDYTLRFDSSSLKKEPEAGPVPYAIAAAAVLAAAGTIVTLRKRSMKKAGRL